MNGDLITTPLYKSNGISLAQVNKRCNDKIDALETITSLEDCKKLVQSDLRCINGLPYFAYGWKVSPYKLKCSCCPNNAAATDLFSIPDYLKEAGRCRLPDGSK